MVNQNIIEDDQKGGIISSDIIIGNFVQAELMLQSDFISELNPGNGVSISVSGNNIVQINTSGVQFGITNTSLIRNDGTFKPVTLDTTVVMPSSVYIKNCHLIYKNEHGIDYSLENTNKRLQSSIFLDDTQEVSLDNEMLSGNVLVNVLNQSAIAPNMTFGACKSSYEIDPSITVFVKNTDTNFTNLNPQWYLENELEISKSTGYSNSIYNIKLTNSTDNCFLPIELIGISGVSIDTKLYGIDYFIIETTTGGPVGQFIVSKSSAEDLPTISRVCHSMGVSGNTRLNISWNPLELIKISKNTINYDGDYTIKKLSDDVHQREDVYLAGISQVSLIIRQERFSGSLMIYSDTPGSPTIFVSLSKNYRGNNAKVLVQSRTRGTGTNEQLLVEWLPNQFIKVSKSNSGYDGLYHVLFV